MVSIVLWQHCGLTMMWSSRISVTSHWSHSSRLPVTSYCDTTVSSRWCGHLIYLWHNTVTTLWPHGDVVISCIFDIIMWQHYDLMVVWETLITVTSQTSHTCDVIISISERHHNYLTWWTTLTTLWPRNDVVILIVSLQHHTMTTLCPHSDVVNFCHCDLTNISHMWCHNFAIMRTSKWPHKVGIILLQHCDLMMMWSPRVPVTSYCDNTYWWCIQLVSLWPHTQLTHVMS